MCRPITASWLVVAFILLGSAPAVARAMTHQGSAVTVQRHGVAGNRFVFFAHAGHHALVFDRFSRRFFALPHRAFASSGNSPFHSSHDIGGFGDVGGFGGWGWGWWPAGPVDGAVPVPEELTEGSFGALPPRPARSPAELPPCHETTSVGVVIERGGGCNHAAG